MLALIDQLFVNPYITVARAAELLEVLNPTARQTVALLQKAGLLKEISGRAWGRLYLAEPILKAIESPPGPGLATRLERDGHFQLDIHDDQL